MWGRFAVYVGCVLFCNLAMGQVTFQPPKVQEANLEGGVRFKVTTQEYKVYYKPDPSNGDYEGGYNYGTAMFAEYQTPKKSVIEKYGIVQFIRGCHYGITKKNETYYFARYLFGERVSFQHKDWVIDSVDTDPMYSNTPQFNGDPDPQYPVPVGDPSYDWGTRHGLYYWNKNPGFYDQKTEVLYYRDKNIVSPRLYIMDHPGTAFYMNGDAKNISLEFRTCLYRIEDIPLKTTASDMDQKKALKCFSWASSYIYNPQTKAYESPQGISPVCLKNKLEKAL